MKILISQATIVDKHHPDNGKVKDILVENGKITAIEAHLDAEADRHIASEGMCASIGWMDLRANFRDPGHEHKENLESGIRAAAAGGFTAVGLSPATQPAIDSKGAVEYVLNRSKASAVRIVPIGAATKGLQGESLSEMYDMYTVGARAFGDCKKSIKESGLLHRALLYSKNFDATILHFPFDASLNPGGQMHEGPQSTRLGIKGIPAIAETLLTDRDLSLLEYTNGRLHLGPLSTAEAVHKVQQAREKGLRASCDTTAAHLAYSDDMLKGFDSAYKLMPPLRDEDNRQALIQALIAGHIQVISSDHSPEDEEHKKLEFDYASFGTAGIEVFWPLLCKALEGRMPLDALVASFSIHPRELLDIPLPQIAVGQEANLTLFSTLGSTTIAAKASDDHKRTSYSKAFNFAERGLTLPGQVIGTLHNGHCLLNTEA